MPIEGSGVSEPLDIKNEWSRIPRLCFQIKAETIDSAIISQKLELEDRIVTSTLFNNFNHGGWEKDVCYSLIDY